MLSSNEFGPKDEDLGLKGFSFTSMAWVGSGNKIVVIMNISIFRFYENIKNIDKENI